jgi:beta-glucosidase
MKARQNSISPVALILALGIWLNFSFPACAQSDPPYRDSNVPVEQRLTDLLSRMTLEEKIAQLGGTWQNRSNITDLNLLFVDEKGAFVPDRAAVLLKNGLGEMSRPSEHRDPKEMAEFTNTVQRWLKEHTRLGIPVLFHEECLHGHAAPKGTAFPQAIALASSWNPDLIHDVFRATAAEVRTRGAQQCLTPVLDLARDPRWGRTEETYGEDPYLTSRLGVAAIQGFQGSGLFIDKSHVIATAKHFAVHGQPEGGTNVAPANYSERVIREYFLKPFESAVKEAHVRSVMASYNEVDGIPSHGNPHLLKEILRQEWGFDGLLVSDYFGIDDLQKLHHVAASQDDAAKMALEAGVDVELPAASSFATLISQVRSGRIAISSIDLAVTHILREKFLTGLFDDPYVDPPKAARITNSPEHQQLALRAARESITLLKNQGHLLPLSKAKYKRIAVIGPNAAEVHLGGYSGEPGRGVSVLAGIKEKVGRTSEILYSLGCKITESAPDWNEDNVVLADPVLNAVRVQEASKIARQADISILVLGGNEQTSREAWAVSHPGDRDSLDLLGNQDDLVKTILALGKPVVVLLLHGRPNSINYIAENVPAVLEGWYLGQETGTAVADVLFGDFNPGGKLPITVPRSVGQLPDYYYQKPSAKREYLGTTTKPLFPFGWGLSYSSFKYDNLKVTPATIGSREKTRVSVGVTNTSSQRGDEVVQLYLRQEVSSVTRPVKELRGFQRVSIDPGETRIIEFTLGPDELSYYDREMRRVVEPGPFTIMVGGNSEELLSKALNVANN